MRFEENISRTIIEMARVLEEVWPEYARTMDLREEVRRALDANRERNEALIRMEQMISDDSHASTFQSMGQYRTALLREIRRVR